MSINAQLPIMPFLAVSKSPVHLIYNIKSYQQPPPCNNITIDLPSFGILN